MGAAADRLGGGQPLDHAEIPAGERGGAREVGIGIGTGQPVLDTPVLGPRHRHPQACRAVVVTPLDVDRRDLETADAAVGIHVGCEQRHGRRQVTLKTRDMREKERRWPAVLGREDVLSGLPIDDALVDMHGTAGFLGVRLGHEGRIDLVAQRRLSCRALEHEGLISKIERIAMQEVDLHLRRTILVDQRVDRDILVLAELVDIVEQRVEFIDGCDAVGLAAGFGAARAADRRLERIVRVDVGLDQVELEFGCDHRIPALLRIEIEHMPQHLARRHPHAPAVGVEAVVDHLRSRLRRPRHPPHRARVGLEDDVDLGGAHRRGGVVGIIAGHGLQEDALRQTHALVALELLGGHHLATRDAGHVRDNGLHFLDVMFAEKLCDLI